MERREFVASFAALGARTALPTVAGAQSSAQSSASVDPQPVHTDALRQETTRQFTPSELAPKDKTISVPRGKRVTS